MAIKKAVFLVLNNKTSSTVLQTEQFKKAFTSPANALTSSIIQSSNIKKAIVTPTKISSQIVGEGAFFIDISDNFLSIDTLTKVVQYIRSFSDSVDIIEILSLTTGKTLSEVTLTSDVSALSVQKALNDSESSSDRNVLNFNKKIQDNYQAIEVLRFVLSKPLSDVRSTSDTQVSIDVSKTLLDIDLFLDNITKLINKSIEDQATSTSSGLLISQNYTEDNTYFLEDYVGESRTFT